MQTVLWTLMTFGVLHSGAFVGLLILSGFSRLERLGYRICNCDIQIGRSKNALKVKIPAIILTITFIALFTESLALTNLRASREAYQAGGNLSTIAELKARVLRHQRNWWLSLTSALTWSIVWRFSSVVKQLRDELSALKI